MPKKIDISPGEGLLLLIQHYKQNAHFISEEQLNDLKRLYLTGACNDEDAVKINECLADPFLEPYQISYKKEIINNDLSRRYFESHLAYETLMHQLEMTSLDELQTHFDAIYAFIFARFDNPDLFSKLSTSEQKSIQRARSVLAGQLHFSDIEADILMTPEKQKDLILAYEYSDVIAKISSDPPSEAHSTRSFSDLDKLKMTLLVKIAYIGIQTASVYPLPLNIYHQGFFTREQRGLIPLEEQSTTQSQHFGLMKGHHAVPKDDALMSPLGFSYPKGSDKSTFAENATYIEHHFKKLVHPFSNSISGTLLAQLRCLAELIGNYYELHYKIPHELALKKCRNCFAWTIENKDPSTAALYYFGLNARKTHIHIDDKTAFHQALQIIQLQQNRSILYLNADSLAHLIQSCGGTMVSTPKYPAVHCNQSSNHFAQFIRLFTSSLLFFTGGHTLNEFMELFQIKAVQATFSSIPEFAQKVNLENMFFVDNQNAFNQALNSTLSYHQTILLRKSTRGLIETDYQNESESDDDLTLG